MGEINSSFEKKPEGSEAEDPDVDYEKAETTLLTVLQRTRERFSRFLVRRP